jgi:hypothetical protein
MPARPLGNASISKLLKLLAQVLDDAIEFGSSTRTRPADSVGG